MLWMKNWHETRLRFLMALLPFLLLIGTSYAQLGRPHRPNPVPAAQRLTETLAIFTIFWVMPSAMLASTGIKTQAPLQPSKGIHGSVHFTLSLPVSRLRLLLTRAGMGLLEMMFVILVTTISTWILLPRQFPELKFSSIDVLGHGLIVFAFAAAVYSLATLFATFLDDIWHMWLTVIVVAATAGLTVFLNPPKSVDVFRALSSNSALLTHTFPWGPFLLSLAVAACLCSAAARSVRERDY